METTRRHALKAIGRYAAALATANILHGTAHAASLAGFATLDLQITQNVELVAALRAMRSISENEYFKLGKELLRLKEMINAAKRLPGDLAQEALSGVQQQMQAWSQFKAGIQSIQGNVEGISSAWKTRFAEATRAGQTFQEYASSQYALLQQGNRRAIARVENEHRMYKAVEEDYRKIRKWGEAIDKTEGVQQSMGLLNSQMNLWIQQNGRVVQMLAQAQGFDKAAKESAEAAEKMRDQNFMTKRGRAYDVEQSSMKSAIQGWSTTNAEQ